MFMYNYIIICTCTCLHENLHYYMLCSTVSKTKGPEVECLSE